MNTCDYNKDGKCDLLEGNCTADNKQNPCQINTAREGMK